MVGDQDVAEAIAVDIDQAQVGIVPVDVGNRRQRHERIPVSGFGALIKPWRGTIQHHAIQVSIAAQIHELMSRGSPRGDSR